MSKRIVIMIALSVLLVAMFAAPAFAVAALSEVADQTEVSPDAPVEISSPGVAVVPM
jgi:flagellar basal body-associated protein FliL